MTVIARWHDHVTQGDPALLDALIAEDCVFQSPAVHSPQVGKAITLKYLRAAMTVLNGPTFRYLDEWVCADKAVLEFEAEVDGLDGQRRRHDLVERGRADHPLQGDGAAAEGAECAGGADGGGAAAGGLEQPEAAAPRGLLLRVGGQVPRFPIMVLDHARADRPALAVARGLEAEAFLDQAAGGGVERPVAAGAGDPAFVGAAVRLDRVDDRDRAADAGLADRGRIVAVADPAADPAGRGEAAAVAIAVTGAVAAAIAAAARAVAEAAAAGAVADPAAAGAGARKGRGAGGRGQIGAGDRRRGERVGRRQDRAAGP